MKAIKTRYCVACGEPTRLIIPDGDDRLRDVCGHCGEIHYINPKVVVGSVCTFQDRLLLCRRAIEPRRGFWTIPAGFMELDETAEAGAKREAMEEANADIRINELIAVYSLAPISQVQLHFRATLLNADVSPGIESLEVDLLPWRDIPWNELAFPSVTWVLEWAQSIKDQPGPVVPAHAP